MPYRVDAHKSIAVFLNVDTRLLSTSIVDDLAKSRPIVKRGHIGI
jgi:hypothetical protein